MIFTETIFSGKMESIEGWGGGGQGGLQADGQTAGTDLVDRKREDSSLEGGTVASDFQVLSKINTHNG